MPTSRRLSETEVALEYFYSRTYQAQYALRIGTVSLVGLSCLHFELLQPPGAALWVGAFLLSELLIWFWWRRISPLLGSMSQRAARRRQHEMIFFCGLSTSTAAAPFLLNAAPSTSAAVVSVLFAAGVIMLIAAQQSMTRNMFLWTAPLPTIALVRNVMLLGEGASAFVMAGLAACFVVNARQLQLSNAAAEAQMVRRRVAAERDNDAKRKFLANVSHEIRTPLNGVLGMAQAMAADELSPRQAERLQIVRRSGAALQALLNDVLDLSKIEAGRLELDVCAFNLADTLTAATEPFLAAAHGKGLDLNLDVAAVNAAFEGDPNRIRQIVTNLVSNAVKFTERGSVLIRASERDGEVVVEVRDTGIGMSPEALGRVFDRFAQADVSTSSQYGGTGLGLAICRELAALMGGQLKADSQPGAGSSFSLTVSLPRALQPHQTSVANALSPTRELGDLRILVAEDNPTNQLVLQHLLASMGDVRVTVVDNGAAALEAYEAQAWDLILMDINMPVLDGVGATMEIRHREAARGRPRIPILALTANAMAHQVGEYLEAGVDGVVAKPVDAAALVETIGHALSAQPRPSSWECASRASAGR